MLKWIIIVALAVGVWQWWGKAAVQQYQAQQGIGLIYPKIVCVFDVMAERIVRR